MALPSAEVARAWGGKTIVDQFGAVIGACTQVYTDDATGLPEWATARIGNNGVLVPLLDAVELDDRVQVSVSRDDVVRAPAVADRLHISPDEEARLYEHYGIPFSRTRSGSVLPEGEGPAPQRGGLRRVLEGAGRGTSALRGSALGRSATRGLRGEDGDRRFAYLLAALVVAGLALLTGLSARTRRRRRLAATEVV